MALLEASGRIEVDEMARPNDVHVVLLQPGQAEDNGMVPERGDVERDSLGVLVTTHQDIFGLMRDHARVNLAAVNDFNDTGLVLVTKGNAVFDGKVLVDKAPCGTRVNHRGCPDRVLSKHEGNRDHNVFLKIKCVYC